MKTKKWFFLSCFLIVCVVFFVDARPINADESSADVLAGQQLASVSFQQGVGKVLFYGDYAYVQSASDIYLVDISNPASPNVRGALIGIDSGSFQFFQVSGHYLYALGADQTGLYVFDISNPGTPVQTGFCSVDDLAWIVDMDVADGYLYVVKLFGTDIDIIDVSDPFKPVVVKTLTDAYSFSFVGNFKIFGRFAYYIMIGYPAIGVIDVSDPLNPVYAGELFYGSSPTAVFFLNGNYLYMGHMSYLAGRYSNSFSVFNLAQWPDTNYLGGIHVSDDGNSSWGFYKAGSYVFGAYRDIGVRVFDVTDPTNMSEVGIFNTGDTADFVRVYHDLVFVGTLSGLEIWLFPELAKNTIPFGTFETPKNGAKVSGSIPVSGWALDDQGIDRVEIFRDPVAGEPGGLVKIGDAVLVDGARPDVEADFPDYPGNYKAGWGYMMLTNRLPNSNGVFNIHALATDVDGHQVNLGTKTITVNNADADEPFGAIDTPFQGGTASGTNYINFGWALTPQPNMIPKDGSTITVWVDGQPLGHPVYNRYRADIATLFPGYRNTDGAVGYFYLDTTRYANGVHNIAWSVGDDAGNREGIGSRYFTIRNTDNGAESASQNISESASKRVSKNAGNHRTWKKTTYGSTHKIGVMLRNAHFIEPLTPVAVKKGYSSSVEKSELTPDENNSIEIQLKQGERVEIHLGNTDRYQGAVMVDKQYKPLPVGSRLDSEKGIFYWQPGPGFKGRFPLIFCLKEGKPDVEGGKVKIVKVLCKIR